MFVKKMLLGAGLAFAVVWGWKFHAEGGFARLMAPKAVAPVIRFDNDGPSATAPGSPQTAGQGDTATTAAPGGIHKCKVGQSLIYTDAPCAHPGSEQAIRGGAVTVVKGQRPQAAAGAEQASASSGVPHVRELLGVRNEPTLMQREMERRMNPP